MTPERPAYFEGQILAAADLTSAVDYGRGQVARHERYLHSWGIAEGLELTANKDVTGTFVNVTLGPGVAIDGTGREIIVPTPFTLSTQYFAAANPSAVKNTAYPILLHGLDSSVPAAALTTGACGGASQPTRTQEGFGLTYGAPGADLNLDQQKVPDESAGPSPDVTQHWEILVGHVQWDPSIGPSGQFTGADNTGRRYAGVMADTVAARGGTLTLQSQPTATPGQPALVIGGDPPVLTFGLYQGGTDVNALLTVTAQGDVTATGAVKGAITPGEILVQSGSITDGLIIPLPQGITQDQVDQGKVLVHLYLTPHTPQSTPATWYVPVDCSVDPGRQLTCQVIVGTSSSFPGTPQQQSGVADYLIMAVPSGANP